MRLLNGLLALFLSLEMLLGCLVACATHGSLTVLSLESGVCPGRVSNTRGLAGAPPQTGPQGWSYLPLEGLLPQCHNGQSKCVS